MDTHFRNFYLAIKDENIEKIRELLPLIEINAYDSVALEVAINTDNFDIICLLLSHGAKEQTNIFDQYLLECSIDKLNILWDLGVRGYAPLFFPNCLEKQFFIQHGSKIPQELEIEFVNQLFFPPYDYYKGYDWSESLQQLLDKKFNCFPYVIHDNLIEQLKLGKLEEITQASLYNYHYVANLNDIFDAIRATDKQVIKNYLKNQNVNDLPSLNKSQLEAIFKINREFHTKEHHSSYLNLIQEQYDEIIPYILDNIEPNIIFLIEILSYCPKDKIKHLFSKFDEYVIDYVIFKKTELKEYLSSVNHEAIANINNLDIVKQGNVKTPGLLLLAIANESIEVATYLAQYTKVDHYFFKFLHHMNNSECIIKVLEIFEQRGIEFNILNFYDKNVLKAFDYLSLPKKHLFNVNFPFTIPTEIEKKVINSYLNGDIKFNGPLVMRLNDYSDTEQLIKIINCDMKNKHTITTLSFLKNLKALKYILNLKEYQNQNIYLPNYCELNEKEILELAKDNANQAFDKMLKILSFQNNLVQFIDNVDNINFTDIILASYKINTTTMLHLFDKFSEKEIIKSCILCSREEIIDLFHIREEQKQLSLIDNKYKIKQKRKI